MIIIICSASCNILYINWLYYNALGLMDVPLWCMCTLPTLSHCVHYQFYCFACPDGVPKPPATVIRIVSWIAFGFTVFFCICGVIFAAVCFVLMLVLWNRR